MTKKEKLLDELNEALRKGELEDKTLITKIELADERLVNSYLDKVEAMRKSEEAAKEADSEEEASDTEEE